MGKRIGKQQTPTKAGYSDVFDFRQHQKYVKDNILAKPEDDAIGGLRFDGTTYLDYTPASVGNRRTFTISFWFKRSTLSDAYQRIFSANDGTASSITEITINNEGAPNTDNIVIERYLGCTQSRYRTVGVFRDINSCYHLVFAI